MGEEMYTTEEAAEMLGVKPGTVRSYIMRKLIKVRKRGAMNFISDSEIERVKQSHSTKPGPKPHKTE